MSRDLEARFGKGESIQFCEGQGGLSMATLRASSGARCEVYLFGAQVVSWRTPQNREVLYLSPKANFSGTKALRGGIPICFPQFSSDGPLPAHGFARTATWQVRASALLESGAVELTLGLSDSAETRKVWDYRFEALFTVRLGAELETTLKVKNADSKPFTFQEALHTYFAIGDIAQTRVEGLNGLRYLDSTKGRAAAQETRAIVDFNGEIDRVYLSAPDVLHIKDGALGRVITIKKRNAPDAVVWNPWAERCKAIGDLPADGYTKFLCVETGNIGVPVKLEPGEEWKCWQGISCS